MHPSLRTHGKITNSVFIYTRSLTIRSFILAPVLSSCPPPQTPTSKAFDNDDHGPMEWMDMTDVNVLDSVAYTSFGHNLNRIHWDFEYARSMGYVVVGEILFSLDVFHPLVTLVLFCPVPSFPVLSRTSSSITSALMDSN